MDNRRPSPLRTLLRRLPSRLLIVLFGLTLTGAAWVDALNRVRLDRESEITRINRENAVLARAFEEHVRRVLLTADNALRYLQQDYEAHGRVTEGMTDFIARARLDPILSQIAVADARGDLVASALPNPAHINIAHREHFKVQAASASAGLYIGAPVQLRLKGGWSIFATRRLQGPGGAFAGIVSVGLNPAYFSSFYDDPDLGPDRGVLLVGTDGIVRARRFQKQSEIGQDLRGSPMFERLPREPFGHYEVVGKIDQLRRFVSYRALPDFPLIVAVSDLSATALAPFERRAADNRLAALIFTLFVAVSCLLLVRAEGRSRQHNDALTAQLAERRRAEEALRESQDLFSAFLEHVPAAVFVQDLGGKVLYSNQAYQNHPARDAIGANARELLAPGASSGAPQQLRGNSVTLDERLVGAEGQPLIYETRMFVVDRAGKEPLLGCVSVDGTARRRAEEERLTLERRMQQTQKLESLGVLAGGVAHDFNNLLLAILGNADLALGRLAPDAPERAYLLNIEAASQRAAELAGQMLAYSGRGHFIIEPLDFSHLVEETGALLGTAVSPRATVRYRLSRDLPAVPADAGQLRQVVANLITNASDALGERDGRITVTTAIVEVGPSAPARRDSGTPLPPGTYASLEVADDGGGMTPATLARIFDPFFTTKHPGRGLGLASVLGIVRGHRGEIRVASEAGRGTTFTVLLPTVAQARPVAPPQPPRAAHAAAAPGATRTVLLVDDENHVLQAARLMLEELGFAVVTAVDGVDAVARFRERTGGLSVVLLDMNMPRMGGAEAFRQIRQIDPAVPVILTSGFDEHDAVGPLAAAGLAGFLQKPFRLRTLLEKIEGAIAAGAPPPA